MEVLISTFVIAIGLLGLAALIPVGRFTLVEAGKADRAGACGRAALRDVKVRGMLDYYDHNNNINWSPVPTTTSFAIDPLGVANGIIGNLGGATGPINRITFNWIASLPILPNNEQIEAAESIFHWHDDLVFHMPEDRTRRPTQLATGLEHEGSYSWFITVTPAANESTLPYSEKRLYTVSVVVCYKRDLSTTGEHTAATAFLGGGYGGGSVRLTITSTNEVDMREGQWIMLYGTDLASGRVQCSWYRLVTVGEVDPGPPIVRYVSLAGPDWDTNIAPTAVIIDGVIGVYTTTIEIDR